MQRIRVSVWGFAVLCLGLGGILLNAQNAQAPGEVTGKVVDSSGAPIADARVSLSDLTTNSLIRTTTSADGQFSFRRVAPDPQLITIEKEGFQSFTQKTSLATQSSVTVNATLSVATLAETVVVRGTVVPDAQPVPTRDDVMLMPRTVRVLDRKQIDAAGPVAGGAQMIQSTPGANVIGYGETGATKYSILLNGIQQGWAGEASSFTAPGSLGITFDGVPVADPATGLWQSATVPQNLMMQDLKVTYGPGAPADRWYTNVGGGVEFTPIQPTDTMHASVALSFGSFGQKNLAFVMNTGTFHGWSTVIGGGGGVGDDYRPAPDGFQNRARDGSAFAKTVKSFGSGSFAVGAYFADAGGYRAQVIPINDVGLIEPDGTHYSQATSGFYSSLPFNAYNKYDTNEMALIYARENLSLSSSTTFQNMTFLNHIRRFHRRLNDLLSPGAQVDEWNNPHSEIFGDELGMSTASRYNTLSYGAYVLHEIYNARNNFFNPLYGGDGADAIIGAGAKFRSGYFQQDDVSLYAQDDFHPIPQLHITPGLRAVRYSTSYSDQAQRDFTFAPGVIYATHCSLNPAGSDPFSNIFGPPTVAADGSTTKDQGSLCGAHAGQSKVEPSINASLTPREWLTLYGGYEVIYRSPSLGGGGGMFQAVDPTYYTLAKGAYSQGGVKVRFRNAPVLKDFIAGVNYFHLDYTNQEIDFETALGLQISGGGDSTYHGVDAFFDDDPLRNLHTFFNFAGEGASFSKYIVGGPSLAECAAQGLSCTSYNNLPVSYVPNVTLNAGAYYGIERNDHVLIEPRLWFNYTGSQHLWSNLTGAPSSQTMPSYLTTNLAFTAPVKIARQSFNLSVDIMNLFNQHYNEWAYISSGGYFAALYPGSAVPSGYVNAYPGAPRSVYGTITYQF